MIEQAFTIVLIKAVFLCWEKDTGIVTQNKTAIIQDQPTRAFFPSTATFSYTYKYTYEGFNRG